MWLMVGSGQRRLVGLSLSGLLDPQSASPAEIHPGRALLEVPAPTLVSSVSHKLIGCNFEDFLLLSYAKFQFFSKQ